MATQTLVPGGDAGRWDQAIYAFLAEKERRSGSMRTVRAYSGMLYRFFGTLGKSPDQVTATEVIWLRPRNRSLRQEAFLSYNRRPHRLPQFLLPLSNPNEPGGLQSMRPA